jgi:hypothetical protein
MSRWLPLSRSFPTISFFALLWAAIGSGIACVVRLFSYPSCLPALLLYYLTGRACSARVGQHHERELGRTPNSWRGARSEPALGRRFQQLTYWKGLVLTVVCCLDLGARFGRTRNSWRGARSEPALGRRFQQLGSARTYGLVHDDSLAEATGDPRHALPLVRDGPNQFLVLLEPDFHDVAKAPPA